MIKGNLLITFVIYSFKMITIFFCGNWLLFVVVFTQNYSSGELQNNNDNNCTSDASISCYECNSLETPNCAINPEQGLHNVSCKFCDTCITAIVEDITYRACSSNLLSLPGITLLPNSTNHCSTSFCNNQVFPSNRLRCHKCSGGKRCVDAPTSDNKETPCLYFKIFDNCFTDVIDESDAVRGCSSDGNYTFGLAVQLCSESGCNKEPGINELQCIECNSEESKGCKRPAIATPNCKIFEKNLCKVQGLLGRQEETCFTYHSLDTVIRGCTRFGGLLQAETNYFKTCNGNLCNQVCMEPTKCFTCKSSFDSNCNNSLVDRSHLMSCESEISSCHTCEHEDKNISRGCGKPQFDTENCYQCQGSTFEGCNQKEIQKCYNCTSQTDPNCSFWSEEYEVPQQICPTPTDSCVTFVKSSGHIYRGCLDKNFDCNYKLLCQDCLGNLCNSGEFPQNRFKCHQCSGSNECASEQNTSSAYPCRKYQKTDGCFTYIDENKQVFRGCLSDNNQKCKLLGDKCFQCNTSRCNYEIFNSPKLSCASCDSTKDPSCFWSQKFNSTKKCKTKPFYLKESCFIHNDNNTLKRGCTLDEDTCHKDERNCEFCDEDGCNIQPYRYQQCVICNSDDNPNCLHPDKELFFKCTGVIYGRRGCYVKRKDEIIIRGCANDLLPQELDKCQNFNGSVTGNSFCQFCEENNCNQIKIINKNESNIMHTSLLLIFSCISIQQIYKIKL